MDTMTWLVADRVLYWRLPNGSTTTDVCNSLVDLHAILTNSRSNVHWVIDARMAQSLVGRTLHVRQLALATANHEQIGQCVVINHHYLFKQQFNRVMSELGQKLTYTETFNHAWQTLYQQDHTLPYIAPNPPELTRLPSLKYA